MRRCAQYHLQSGRGGALSSADVDSALEEMLFSGGSLNAKLLGATGVTRETVHWNRGSVHYEKRLGLSGQHAETAPPWQYSGAVATKLVIEALGR
jgi:hypothetical protein